MNSNIEKSWKLTNHCCRICFGRVLKRRLSPSLSEVVCSICDATARGDEPSLCWCGVEVGAKGKILECFLNPKPRPELPPIVLVRERQHSK